MSKKPEYIIRESDAEIAKNCGVKDATILSDSDVAQIVNNDPTAIVVGVPWKDLPPGAQAVMRLCSACGSEIATTSDYSGAKAFLCVFCFKETLNARENIDHMQ